MKSNDKENYINELKPHSEASSGYALSLVEVGDEMDIDNLINSQIC